MGGCEVRDLPMVENSRRILVKPFRGNVVKYKCRTHMRLFGNNLFYCTDGGNWGGGKPPICTRPGCDESQVHQIPYGTSKKMMKGALYQFSCDEGAVLSGSPSIFCDGKTWNDTLPTCLSKSFFLYTNPITIIFFQKKSRKICQKVIEWEFF